MAIALTSSPAAITFSKNDIEVILTASGYSSLDNYKVKFEVEFEDGYQSGTFTKIVSGDLYPSSDGTMSVKLEKTLHGHLKNAILQELPLPSILTPAPTIAKISRGYKVRYTESYGVPPVEQTWAEITGNEVILGGINPDDFTSDYLTTISGDDSIFTNQPDCKMVGYDQPEYFNWFNYTSDLAVCSYKSYDKNGSVLDSGTKTLLSSQYEVIMFPVGPEQLGLNSNTVRYTVQIFRGSVSIGNEVSSLRNYYIDPRHYEWKYDLIYFNIYNVPEILRTTGTKRESLDVSRSKTQDENGKVYQYDYDFNQVLQYTTGNMSRLECKALQELLVYNDLYEIDLDKQIYIPLDLVGSSYDISETRRFLNALSFQARISVKKKVLQLE